MRDPFRFIVTVFLALLCPLCLTVTRLVALAGRFNFRLRDFFHSIGLLGELDRLRSAISLSPSRPNRCYLLDVLWSPDTNSGPIGA